MPRLPSPRYFPSRKAYYCQYQGKQHCLAVGPICMKCAEREKDGSLPTCLECRKVRHAADLRFAELQHASDAYKAQDNSLVISVLDSYCVWLKTKVRKPATVKLRVHYLQSATNEFGHVKVKELRPGHVEDWLQKHKNKERKDGLRPWGPTTRRIATNCLNMAFNWAVKRGEITTNPIWKKTDRPRERTRGADCVITPAEHVAVMGRAKPPFRDLLSFLEDTGCRPGEAINATASHWRDDIAAFEFLPVEGLGEHGEGYTHKTATTSSKRRTVYVRKPEVVALVRRLVAKYPSGPVFRTATGKVFKGRRVSERLKCIVNRLNLNRKIIPYSYRHKLITELLLNGMPIALVAEVMGNSVAQIEKNYSHVNAERPRLRNILLSFSGLPADARPDNPPLLAGPSSPSVEEEE